MSGGTVEGMSLRLVVHVKCHDVVFLCVAERPGSVPGPGVQNVHVTTQGGREGRGYIFKWPGRGPSIQRHTRFFVPVLHVVFILPLTCYSRSHWGSLSRLMHYDHSLGHLRSLVGSRDVAHSNIGNRCRGQIMEVRRLASVFEETRR